MVDFDVIVIGAGGAGMMCAMQAGQRGRRVCLLDHTTKLGRKILISGGGRCNFTNIHAGPDNYVSQNPHFAKSALAQFTPDDFIRLVRKHRIAYHEKKLGQLFCDGSAENIVNLLQSECESAGVEFHLDTRIDAIDKGSRFELATSRGKYTCESLVIATGGLSIPKIGATAFGYDVARQFGLAIVEPFPALVGINFNNTDIHQLSDLAGVSLDTRVTCNDGSFRENILFTHTGLSGPAILQASLYWKTGQPIEINTSPETDLYMWLENKKKLGSRTELKNLLADILPKRLAERFCELHLPSKPIVQYSEKALAEFAAKLSNWSVRPASNFGYAKAEVTRGGVSTKELSSKTMGAKKVDGLYFIGEVVDVTGQLGGFNFQWAWASGYAAGQNA